MTPEERAKQIDLGDGAYCCQRATGGICYEHEQIAAAIRAAVNDALEEAAVKLEALEFQQMHDSSASALVRSLKVT